MRNALTKLSAIHFTSTPTARRRVIAMGEEALARNSTPAAPSLRPPAPVTASHAPRHRSPSRPQPPSPAIKAPTILVAWHPVTILKDTNAEADALFDALAQAPGQLLFCYPNADAGSYALIERTRALAESRANTHIFVNLDPIAYWSLLGQVDAMIGNSSSGIMEAASFALPTVNIGIRQQGRERARNVIDAPAGTEAILCALDQALDPDFREDLRGMENPYGNGTASATIARVLTTVPLDGLLMKQPTPLPKKPRIYER